MTHSLHTKQQVFYLHGKGLSSRNIAKQVGVGKSTVNNWLSELDEQPEYREPKILYADIETALMTSYHFSLGKQYMGHKNIITDWFIHCGQYMWEHELEVKNVSQIHDKERFEKDHHDDYHVVKKLWDLMAEADYVVFQNGDRFDVPRIMLRAIKHGLKPIKMPMQIDTMKMLRKTGISSSSLDYASRFFELSQQKRDNNFGWWVGAYKGDLEAHKSMLCYGDGDLHPMRDIYKIYAPYFPQMLPNANILTGAEFTCPVPACGGELERDGQKPKGKTSVVASYRCKKCGAYSDDGMNLRKAKGTIR